LKTLIVILPILLLAFARADAEIIPGQAVSWTDFSHITGIAVGQDFAYFGTTEGILRYHRLEEKWYEPITVSDGLGDKFVHRLAVSFDDQRIAVETDAGIYTYEYGIDLWFLETEFPLEDYRDSRPSPPLPLILMPIGYQMMPRGYIEDNYFRQYEITAWLDDYFNSIFAGAWGLGPIRIDSRDMEAELIPYGLLQKQTDVIYIEGDSIWLGGNAGDRPPEYADARLGVTLFDRSTHQFTHFEPRFISGFDSEIIYDIAGDEKNLYFAGRQGLTIKPRNDDYYVTLKKRDGLPESETTALVMGNDSLWVGTSRGLAMYTPSADTIIVVGRNILKDRFVTDLEIAADRLIIGTDKGAYYIDVKTKKIGRLKDPSGNLAGLIYHITVTGEDLLIASDYGLTLIDLKTEKASTVPYTDAGGVYAVAANEIYIAAAVEQGLMLIERETGKKRVFTEWDGLLSLNISTMVPDGEYLWLGSDQGLTRFQWINPDRVD
jgi:hypothetical protein